VNYYPFHLGDYAAHTAHLEPLEDLAYRRMLDAYYLREGPLPTDVGEVARLVRMRKNQAEVEAVLREFFSLLDDGWHQDRCDSELGRMREKQVKAQASAQLAVAARRAKRQPDGSSTDDRSVDQTLTERSTERLPNGQPNGELPTPTPTPKEEKPSASSPAKLPTCPTERLVDLYHEVLPELPRVRLATDGRKRALQKTWTWCLTSKRGDGTARAQTAEEALAWFREYFERARQNDFLMGRTPRAGEHANWRCDLDFLLTEKGMKHVIEKTLEPA
jgi:uncharacterized protein YdaU (DUF1376 family)